MKDKTMGLLSLLGRTKTKPRKRKIAGRRNALRHEQLEPRQMLTLLGIDPGFPLTVYNSTGHLEYNPGTQAFDLTATPLAFKASLLDAPTAVEAPASMALHIRVNSAGEVVGGVVGDDLVVTGSINDGTINVSGVLLTGEIVDFGFADSGATDSYDFRFVVTGGALASLFAGKDIGITTTSEQSTFTGSFQTAFEGGAKGNIGTVDQTTGSLSGRKFKDKNGDGIGPGDTPLGGVTIQLFRDVDNSGTFDPVLDGPAVAQTVTANGTGAYSFNNVQAGTYFVVEVPPAGTTQTFPDSTYYTVVVTSGSNTTDLDFANKPNKVPCEPKDPCKPSWCDPKPCKPVACDPPKPSKPNCDPPKPSKPNCDPPKPSKPVACDPPKPSKPGACDPPKPEKPSSWDSKGSGSNGSKCNDSSQGSKNSYCPTPAPAPKGYGGSQSGYGKSW
jgi:hypothetical protein